MPLYFAGEDAVGGRSLATVAVHLPESAYFFFPNLTPWHRQLIWHVQKLGRAHAHEVVQAAHVKLLSRLLLL